MELLTEVVEDSVEAFHLDGLNLDLLEDLSRGHSQLLHL